MVSRIVQGRALWRSSKRGRLIVSASPQTALPLRPAFEPTQEVRFAVVMYGGVSLAIYINGVVQELLQLVRATAPNGPSAANPAQTLLSDDELKGTTGAVYREAGQLLEFGRTLQGDERARPRDPVRTRFIVDVLSGTSAGGINGVYLAKALANNQSIDQLKQLWVEEGDIAKLVNDAGSYKDLHGLARERPPRGALNAKRMYCKLLDALHGMDGDVTEPPESPLVDELDLWITTTDIRGVTVPIDLYDRLVLEKRHRKVFHFVYRSSTAAGAAKPRSHFERKYNPFLAFVARCTSAFPFAFEPMQLADIDEVLATKRFRSTYGSRTSVNVDWAEFFEEYIGPSAVSSAAAKEEQTIFRTQSFGDGGYLDNKPFTWATDTLDRRRADLPVDRRLVYIEPDPGAPQVAVHRAGGAGSASEAWERWGPLAHVDPQKAHVRPNALENALAAITGIPRYEPIREDLERLVKRNRDVERIQDVAEIVREGERILEGNFPKPLDVARWRDLDVSDLLRERGLQYAAYHRLKIYSVSDDLASLLTHLAGLDQNSDEYAAIRCLVQAWVDRHHPEDGSGEHSQFEFLFRYDLSYRLRRVAFLQRKADDQLARQENEAAVAELRRLKSALSRVLTDLRLTDNALRLRDPAKNELLRAVNGLGIGRPELREILDGSTTKRESVQMAREMLDKGGLDERLTGVADVLSGLLDEVFRRNRDELEGAINAIPSAAPARQELERDFEQYELYDSVLFPLSYGNVGETDRVEVIRVSPHDATSIIDETDATETRRKLAGMAVHHYGGFLDRSWRRNDILWGRLDGAERILTTMLPEGKTRDTLLEKAQLAIIDEELTREGRDELHSALIRTILGDNPPEQERQRLASILRSLEKPKRMLAFMKEKGDGYEVDRNLEGRDLLASAGRLTVVSGDVLDGVISAPAAKRAIRWVARIGRFAWGLAEISTRRSVRSLLWRWWGQLIVIAAVLMIVVGALFGVPTSAQTGWIVLGLLAALKVATWIAEEATGSGPGRRRLLRGVTLLLLLVATSSSVWAVIEVYRSASDEVDRAICRLPSGVASRVQAGWPFDDDNCPPTAAAKQR